MPDDNGSAARLRHRASLTWRLPLLISGLAIAVLLVAVAAAYRVVVTTLERTAGDRARQAATQVTTVLAPSMQQATVGLQRAEPAVRAYLAEPTDAHLANARAVLATVNPSPTRRVTVWDASGARLFEIPARSPGDDGSPQDPVPAADRPPPAGIGEIRAAGQTAFVDTAIAVHPEGAPDTTLGLVSARSVLIISPPDLLSRLIGNDARILFGNRGGGLWTDMQRIVSGPAVDPAVTTVQRYRHDDGDDRIGAIAAFQGAPWVVWVEFPRASVVSSAQTFLRGMFLLVLGVAAAAVWLVRRVVLGVTGPLAEMTTAAETMAGGDYTVRVPTDRPDEIGRLGRAFNAMTDDVAREMAARTEALDQLRASEGRYRTLFDYAPDGILIADPAGRYLDANSAMCRMLGYSRDELVGRSAEDIVAPEEQRHIDPALEDIGAQRAYQREWRFRRRDGTIFDADVIGTQMPDGNIMAMVRDITDRNIAIEAVRTAEERMRFALESAEAGIWDLDYRTGVVTWSAILASQHGLAPAAFDGTMDSFLNLVHPNDRDRVRRTFDEATARGGDFVSQHRIVRPDGTQRWLNGAGRVVLDAAGRPIRAVGISLDVTAQHTLEAQFQQAQKMEAIGRLAGGVAHDFNNLLTAILGYCELMAEDLRPEDPLRRELGEIEKAGRQAAELTRQLLAFSRKQIIEPTLLDLNAVVDGLHSLLRRLISEDVEIVVGLDPAPMMVSADRSQIEQIIMNLAVNARDAMPEGGRLTIGTALVELDETYAATHFRVMPGVYVALTVTDTGVGMTPEVQSHLFEPFFTTKEAGKGTGLGLATVHGAVTRSGGSVGVYSEVGRGTSFKIYLPRADAGAGSEARPAAPSAAVIGHGHTVLVVDDAEGLRQLMERTLTRQGFEVLVAADAAEATRLVEAQPSIDVLLTDVIMPGASGPELTLDLQQRRPGLKVIYMSGYTEDAIVHHGVLKPGVAFLHKPFTAQALGQKIREVLGR